MNGLHKRILIRRAAPDDIILISVLASTCFYEAYLEQDESANLAAYIHESFDFETVRSEIADPASIFFIVFLDGKAVGYARLIENSRAECIAGSNPIELRRIYILERVWKIGIGKSLLEHCLNAAALGGFDTIWLGVWEENRRAQKFYIKHGFVRVGTVTFPYGDTIGVNWVMEKTI